MGIQSYLAIGGATLAVLLAIPFLLPANARIERSADIAAAPEAVFQIINSARGFNRFNPFKDTDPQPAIAYSGPDEGPGASFSRKGKEGAGFQTISRTEANRMVAMQIDLGSMGRPVQTFTLAPVAGGTRIVWSLDASFGMNPVARVYGLFMDGMLGPVYERGLQNLSRVATLG